MRRANALLIAILFLMLTARPSYAHTWTSYYTLGSNARWSEANDHDIRIYAHANMVGTAFRSRALDGAKAWEGHADIGDFNFLAYGEGSFSTACPPPEGFINFNWMQFGDPPVSALAETNVCWVGDTIKRFYMVFDTDPDGTPTWYTGTGLPAGNQYDAWSTGAHEFGHANGFREQFFAGETECTLTNYYHTMCTAVLGTPDSTGSWRRNLNTHDLHTFQGAY